MRKILVSQCLCGGEPVRYDGKLKSETNPLFLKWKEEGRFVTVCPEVFGGLPVPRAEAQRRGDKVVTIDERDVTAEYTAGAEEAVRLALEHDVVCAILKAKSPSCGNEQIYDGTFTRTLIDGEGVAAEMLRKAGIKVFSEKQLEEAREYIEG
jgi:uncharacterized protein YbbK (DUF523 family)